MDSTEILYDAFKESFIQARRVYRVTITVALLTMMIILLVVRDGVILKTSEPKMVQYMSELSQIEKKLSSGKSSVFKSSSAYLNAHKKWKSASAEVTAWSKNLPARKKMQIKYNSLLKEYSGNHDKVLGRLKIDGEPGMKLYQLLRSKMEAETRATLNLDMANKKRDKSKKRFYQNQAGERYALNDKKKRVEKEIDQLRTDLERIQHDQTRIPWLGLRVNPRDLLTLMPLILLALFHVLFDSFDELLSIMRRPELKQHSDALRVYPVPAFLQRRTVFSWMTVALLYGLIPLIQIVAVVMIYRYEIGLLGFSADSWLLAASVGSIATLLTISHPLMMLRKHYDVLKGSPR